MVLISNVLAGLSGALATYSLSGNWVAAVGVGSCISLAITAIIANRN